MNIKTRMLSVLDPKTEAEFGTHEEGKVSNDSVFEKLKARLIDGLVSTFDVDEELAKDTVNKNLEFKQRDKEITEEGARKPLPKKDRYFNTQYAIKNGVHPNILWGKPTPIWKVPGPNGKNTFISASDIKQVSPKREPLIVYSKLSFVRDKWGTPMRTYGPKEEMPLSQAMAIFKDPINAKAYSDMLKKDKDEPEAWDAKFTKALSGRKAEMDKWKEEYGEELRLDEYPESGVESLWRKYKYGGYKISQLVKMSNDYLERNKRRPVEQPKADPHSPTKFTLMTDSAELEEDADKREVITDKHDLRVILEALGIEPRHMVEPLIYHDLDYEDLTDIPEPELFTISGIEKKDDLDDIEYVRVRVKDMKPDYKNGGNKEGTRNVWMKIEEVYELLGSPINQQEEVDYEMIYDYWKGKVPPFAQGAMGRGVTLSDDQILAALSYVQSKNLPDFKFVDLKQHYLDTKDSPKPGNMILKALGEVDGNVGIRKIGKGKRGQGYKYIILEPFESHVSTSKVHSRSNAYTTHTKEYA